MPVLVADTIELETDEILARVCGGTMSRRAVRRSYSDSSFVMASRSDVDEISESKRAPGMGSLVDADGFVNVELIWENGVGSWERRGRRLKEVEGGSSLVPLS